MRLVQVAILVGAVDLICCDAFQHSTWTWTPTRRRIYEPFFTELSVVSKPRRGSDQEDKGKPTGWDTFKRTVYNSVDGVNEFTSKIIGGGEKEQSEVSDGYKSFEQSLRKNAGPGDKLMSEYRARASTLGVDKMISSSSESKSKPRTSFDSFKENLYSASDAFGALSAPKPEPTPLEKLERNIPYKKSLAQELGVGGENVEDLFSDNPVKRFQAQQEIREQEARRRAEARNERIRAKKEDLYKVVDALQAAVDSFPETIDKAEKAIKNTVKAVKEVPTKVGKAVEEVKTIPILVKRKAYETKLSVEDTVDRTRKAVDGVVDIPNKVTKKVQDTKEAVINTKKSIDEGITNTKVFLRLEKPKPKPPKLPPPKTKTAKEIAKEITLSIAGSAASGVGKATWWATKSVTTAAWNSASSAIQERKNTSTKQPAPPASLPASKTYQTTAELQKEVDEALRLADETMRKVDEE